MRLERYRFIVLLMGVLLASCEKKEIPVTLPAAGSAQIARADMGEDYQDQLFFDFELGKVVSTSKVNSWDLAFEAGSAGSHVFINGGKNIFVYNTHSSETAELVHVSDVNADNLAVDASCGLPDSTAIGDWYDRSGKSRNEVYILKMGDGSYKKIQLISVDASKYVLAYGDLASTELNIISIPKNDLYNYSYFTFSDGGSLVTPEPPKATWDIVFTRYRIVYHELNNFPYIVSGVLLNPYNTQCAADSSTEFSSLTFKNISTAVFTNRRDIIGFDWKQYNFTSGKYTVNSAKGYVLRNRNGQYWKLHFLDFYSPDGLKGSPSFEFERIQ